jgi:Cu2+-exporting ATPase
MPFATACPATPADAGRLLLLDDPQEQTAFTRLLLAADNSPRAVSQFALAGLRCAACAGLIEDALMQVDGVLAARVVSELARAEVTWDPARTRPSLLVAAVRHAGYDAAPDLAAPARALRERAWRRSLWQLFVAGFCMMQVMMYAAPAYFAAPGGLAPDMLRLLQWASWLLSIPVLLFSAADLLRGAWRGLLACRLGMDVPVALGIVVTFVASTAATFDPGGLFGHEVYFDSLTMFVFFLLAGRALELRARHRIAAALEATLPALPDSVLRIAPDGSTSSIARRQLRVGDRVQVNAGRAFPADGCLESGVTQASEAMLTGESSPVHKRSGDRLSAGSLNLLAPVVMTVERLGVDTRLEAIVALVRGASGARPEAVRLADRWAGAFLASVLLLAAAAAAVWSLIDPARAVWVAVSVLIVTCPCALSLATPSALLSAAGALARRGVLVQRLVALETLAHVDCLFVDKTGTLTDDRLDLRTTLPQPAAQGLGLDAAALLSQAASLAAFSAHPLARALVAACPDQDTSGRWQQLEEQPGQGLQAQGGDGQWYRLGSRAWVENSAPAVADVDAGAAHVWFGPRGQAWVQFVLQETLRADAMEAITRLQRSGLHVALLSGDQPARVAAMAARLGLHDARGGMTPEAKLQAVAAAQAAGHRVAMVGDGLNDAPVLARADMSFAFAHGAALSQSQADVVLLGHRLAALADTRDLAQRTLRVVRQNLAWAAAYNLVCIPLALLSWLPPWAAGLGMAGSSLLVVMNALRLQRPI